MAIACLRLLTLPPCRLSLIELPLLLFSAHRAFNGLSRPLSCKDVGQSFFIRHVFASLMKSVITFFTLSHRAPLVLEFLIEGFFCLAALQAEAQIDVKQS